MIRRNWRKKKEFGKSEEIKKPGKSEEIKKIGKFKEMKKFGKSEENEKKRNKCKTKNKMNILSFFFISIYIIKVKLLDFKIKRKKKYSKLK